ncbi:MAG: hypothetical protein Q4F88_00730 [Eubacteriales bacterium]|nr:hypothetical protein [Eubacteriales bacterium]
MNIITIFKREVYLYERRKIIPILSMIIGIIFAAVLLILFNETLSEAYVKRELNYIIILNVMKIMTLGIFALVLIIGPIFVAGSLNQEKQNGHLDMIMTTNISKGELVLAKILHSTYSLIFIIISILPIFSLSFIFGGFSLVKYLYLSIILILTSFVVSTSGILISGLFNDNLSGIFFHYLFCFLIGAWLFYQINSINFLFSNFLSIVIVEIFATVVLFLLTINLKIFKS